MLLINGIFFNYLISIIIANNKIEWLIIRLIKLLNLGSL